MLIVQKCTIMLDWDDLRVFLAVAREGSLSGAARGLALDQSTIGRRIAALEARAGARLFDRRRHGYLLAPAGEAVVDSVSAIESHAFEVERKLLGHDERIEGPVRIATSDSFAVWFLVQQLPELKQLAPALSIELVTGNPPLDLVKREADISFRLRRPTQPELVARRLAKAGWAIYAAKSYTARHGAPNPRAGFSGHDVLGYAGELKSTLGSRWLEEHAKRARQPFSSNSLLSQAAAVACGLGVSALPCIIGDRDPALSRFIPGVIGAHDLWLVVHPDVRRSARVRCVMDYLAARITASASELSGNSEASLKPPRKKARAAHRR